MVAFASSFDQAGIFARRAEDCALGLNVICGFDPRDSTSLDAPDEDFAREINAAPDPKLPLKGKTIGVPREFFSEGLSDQAAQKTREAIIQLEKLGAQAREISLPSLTAAIPAYYVLTCAEASSNLARYDGVRYGRRAQGAADLREMYCKSRAEGFGREVKLRILAGTFVLSHGYYDAYYRRAAKIRRMIADDFQRAFSGGVRRRCRSGRPRLRFWAGGDWRKRPGADVYAGCVYRPGQPGRTAGPLRAVRILPKRNAAGAAADRAAHGRGADFERCPFLSNPNRFSLANAKPAGGFRMTWETVIGLEIHARLSTRGKIFSPSASAFCDSPNVNISEVDLGMPGALPVLNRAAVECAARLGLAIGGKVNAESEFARKNYFYPDLPKGYQISQYEHPMFRAGKCGFSPTAPKSASASPARTWRRTPASWCMRTGRRCPAWT